MYTLWRIFNELNSSKTDSIWLKLNSVWTKTIFSANIWPCPVKCLPNEMQSLFHRGATYFSGVTFSPSHLPTFLRSNLLIFLYLPPSDLLSADLCGGLSSDHRPSDRLSLPSSDLWRLSSDISDSLIFLSSYLLIFCPLISDFWPSYPPSLWRTALPKITQINDSSPQRHRVHRATYFFPDRRLPIREKLVFLRALFASVVNYFLWFVCIWVCLFPP